MKFYILLITLVVIVAFTSVKATGIYGNNNSIPGTEMEKKDCGKIIAEYHECLPCLKPTKNMEQMSKCCDTINSEKCAKLFKKKITDHEPCISSGGHNDTPIIDAFVSEMVISCAKDEQDNYCPLTSAKLNNTEITKDTVTKTCQSPKCRDKMVQRLPELIQFKKDLGMKFDFVSNDYKSYDDIINALNEDQCKTLAHVSGTLPTFKFGSSILLTILLFLYLI